jgi:hypothetical protein
MARSSKGARNITVDGVAYRWRASGNDGHIDLTVWPAEGSGAAIECRFAYGEVFSTSTKANGAYERLQGQTIITNRIVRRVLDHAVQAHGYQSSRPGSPFSLGSLDGIVDVWDALRSRVQ